MQGLQLALNGSELLAEEKFLLLLGERLIDCCGDLLGHFGDGSLFDEEFCSELESCFGVWGAEERY